MNIISRSGELLVEHSCAVAERSGQLCGWVHDGGKATKWGQRYLDDDIEASPVDLKMKTHGRVGGYLAYYCARQRGLSSKRALLEGIAIAKHHGNVPNTVSFIKDHFPGTERWIEIAHDQLDSGSEAPGDHNVKALAQIRNINAADERCAVVDKLIEKGSAGAGSWADFYNQFSNGDLQREMRMSVMKHPATNSLDREAFNDNWYSNLIHTYAAIQYADQTHAGGVSNEALTAAELPARAITNHVADLAADATDQGIEGALNEIRSTIQQEITDRLDNGLIARFSNGGVAQLTIPTGYGKTFASGLFAERLLMADSEEKHDRRIVYALPFTTIADQTAEEFEDAFLKDDSDIVDPLLLSIDHHRAETPTDRVAEDREVATRSADTILSGWRSRVTVTTTVQLFESIVGPFRSQSIKLPSLKRSVIIVDEPQAIPIGWRPLVARAIKTLVDEYDATVLLMTATQPYLVDNNRDLDSEVIDLIPGERLATVEQQACDAAEITTIPNRVIYEFDDSVLGTDENGALDPTASPNPLQHNDAAERVVTEFVANPEPAMTICNSVKSTRQFTDAVERYLHSHEIEPVCVGAGYDNLLDRDSTDPSPGTISSGDLINWLTDRVDIDADSAVPLFHFTRQVPPAKLFTMIKAAKQLTERGIDHLVVSTQLVEAGVDISYRRVYRDFAPLDSIVQAAGRCNRSFEWGIDGGDVVVWTLNPVEDGTGLPSDQVYNTARSDVSVSTNTLRRSRKALIPLLSRSSSSPLREADLRDAVETYHNDLANILARITEDEDHLLRAYGRGDGRTLRQASLIEEKMEVDVTICTTCGDWQLVDCLRKKIDEEEWETATQIRKTLQQVTVSVPVYSFDSDRWANVSKLELLIADNDEQISENDAFVVDTVSELVDPRDGIQMDE